MTHLIHIIFVFTVYEPPNDTKMGAYNFVRKFWQDGKIHDQVEVIPYKDRPKDWESDEAFKVFRG